MVRISEIKSKKIHRSFRSISEIVTSTARKEMEAVGMEGGLVESDD